MPIADPDEAEDSIDADEKNHEGDGSNGGVDDQPGGTSRDDENFFIVFKTS